VLIAPCPAELVIWAGHAEFALHYPSIARELSRRRALEDHLSTMSAGPVRRGGPGVSETPPCCGRNTYAYFLRLPFSPTAAPSTDPLQMPFSMSSLEQLPYSLVQVAMAGRLPCPPTRLPLMQSP
jgi:hypothetical protein